MRNLISIILAAIAVSSCSTHNNATSKAEISKAPDAVVIGGNRMLPPIVIYKTSGNYDNNVPVTLAPDGKSLVSYPAPTDVSAEYSAPLPLAAGFLLDRRGISENSVFTRYTYAEYAGLHEAPSPSELIKAIIPDAKVTEVVTIPRAKISSPEDTAAINNYIRTKILPNERH